MLDQTPYRYNTSEGDVRPNTACVFNPPLNGKETHNAEGAYALEAEGIAE